MGAAEPDPTGTRPTGTRPNGSERHLATAMVSLAGGEVLGKVATLITLAWSARVIGVEAFGVFTLGMGLGVILSTIPALAPASRMIQLVGRRTETLGVHLASLNVLRWAFTVPAMAIAVPFVLMRSSAVDRWTIALLVASCLLDNTIKVWLAACTALDRQSATALVFAGQRFVTLALVGVALLTEPSSATVAAAFALGSLLANIAMAWLARRVGARPDYRSMKRQNLRQLLVATPVAGGSAILTEALGRVDVILIGLLAGDTAVGLYGVAYRLMETALFVSWTLARALTPDLVRARLGEELRQPVRLGVVILSALYLPYGAILAFAGDDIVALVFGPHYAVGHVLVLLGAAPLLFGFSHFASVALFARRPDPVVPLATALALAVNLLLNVLLLPRLHADAAALAKTAAFAVEALVLGFALNRIAPLRGARRGILVSVVATAVACIPVLVGLPIVPALVLAVAIYCSVWFLLVRRFDPVTAAWFERAVRPSSAPASQQRPQDSTGEG